MTVRVYVERAVRQRGFIEVEAPSAHDARAYVERELAPSGHGLFAPTWTEDQPIGRPGVVGVQTVDAITQEASDGR